MERRSITVVVSAFAAVGVAANLLWGSPWMWERLQLMRWVMLVALGGAGAVLLAMGVWEAVSRERRRKAWQGAVGVCAAGALLVACGVAGFARGAGVPILADRLSPAAVSRQLSRDAREQNHYARRVSGVVDRVQRLDAAGPASYVYVCKPRRPVKGAPEEFSTDAFTFELDGALVGSPVSIYLDPEDPKAYYVASGPLLQEMESRRAP